jgi:hypothetical protein
MPHQVELIGTADGVPGVLRERGLSAVLASRPEFTDAGDLTLPAPQPRRGPSGLLAEDALIAMIEGVRARRYAPPAPGGASRCWLAGTAR